MILFKRVLIATFLLTLLVGCSDSDSDEEVVSLRFLADDIAVGESVRVEIEFVADQDNFGDVRATEIVAEISSALQYERGSVRISDGPSDTDGLEDADIEVCEDGRSFARFSLSRDDIRGQLLGRGRYRLQFNVVGVATSRVATVEASAGSGLFGNCASDFRGQEEDAVEVL